MILAIVEDLIFRGKMEAAAKELGAALTIARDVEGALGPAQDWSRVLIDLNLSHGDAVAMIRSLRAARLRRPALPSPTHLPVGTRARSQALEAGCTIVLPRSAFIQQLPELLSIETFPDIPR